MIKTFDLKAAAAATTEHQARHMTLAELLDAWTAVTLDGSDLRMRKWREAFATTSAWDVTTEQLSNCALALHEAGYSPATVNRDLSSLGSAYKWATHKRLAPRNFRSPTLGVERFEEPIRRVEIAQADVDRLRARALAARDRRFGAFIHLLLDTGARKSEILERRWRDVDLVHHTITCPTTKTGRPRVLHIRPETVTLMRRIWKSTPADDLLFGNRIGQPVNYRTAWRLLTQELGLEHLHIHDLRHIVAASLLRAGVTVAVASQVLGHSSLILQRRYGHLETATLRAAQEQRWGTAA